MQHQGKYRVSAVAATTVTLVPDDGTTSAGDYSDKISGIVITFTNARDTNVFDVTNRHFTLTIERD